MYCNKKTLDSKISSELKKLVGNNEVLHANMLLNVFNEDTFKDDFISWYKEKHPKAKELSLDINQTTQAKNIAKEILNYYYYKKPNVDSTARITESDEAITKFGYSSVFEREAGLRHVRNAILDIFNAAQNANVELPKDKYKYYVRQIRNKWLNLLFDSIVKKTNKDINDVRTEYKNAEDKMAYLETILNKDGLSITDQNRLAVYRELFASRDVIDGNTQNNVNISRTTLNYMQEVFADIKLADVRAQVRNDLEAESTRLAIDASKEENGNTSENSVENDDLSLDITISSLTNHIGVYTTFMTHVGARIRNYFNSLKKLNSPNVNDFDTNNTYGIPETMDANACASMLYNSNVSFKNIPTMIESIQRIGEQVAGFEAFVTLAQDLRNNLDFAEELFTVFAKIKVNKIETRTEDGKAIVRTSNIRATPNAAFVFDLINDIKSTAIDNIPDVMINVYNNIKSNVEFVKRNAKQNADIVKEKVNTIKQDLIKLFKVYYPSIQEAAILSYIELNNTNNKETDTILKQIENITKLLQDIQDTIDNSRSTQKAYNTMIAQAAEIKAYNESLDEKRKNKVWVDYSEYKDPINIYSDDFVKAQTNAIQNIVKKLLPYSVIDTSLNSRNIYGNNNSDVINSSLLTQLTKMLEDNYEEIVEDDKGKSVIRIRNKALEAWGVRKLKSKQYKYSNVLLEQTDENGKILNKGLFKYIDGQLCITPYASELLSINYYNGAGNIDNGTNVSYSDMLSGDFLPTSFINFFKTENKTNNLKNVNLANYFLRTPSDAPKTFTIQAPRYDTTDLFKIKDETALNNDIESIIKDNFSYISIEDYVNNFRNTNESDVSKIMKIKDKDTLHYLFPKNSILINNNNAIREIKDEDGNSTAYLSVANESGNLIVLEGTIIKAGNGKALSNPKLTGIVGVNVRKDNTRQFDDIPDDVKNILANYYKEELKKHDIVVNDKTYKKAEQVVNTNHPVYKMIKNQFKQELLDCGVALQHYFELKQQPNGNYVVKFNVDNKPAFRKDRKNTEGYRYYHLGKDGKVITEKDGEFVLGGNVFHSTKFTLAKENEDNVLVNRNYLDEIITTNSNQSDNGMINLLYGDGFEIVPAKDEQGNVILDENNNIIVDDIFIGSEQNQLIDKQLNDFLLDYIDDLTNDLLEYSEFISNASIDVNVNDTNIIEYGINQLLMHYNYDELLEGNTKFYKDSQTILKRAKEYQGSGVPYGISNYSSQFEPNLNEVEYAFLNIGTIEEDITETEIDDKGKQKIRKVVDENGNVKKKTTKISDILDSTELFKNVRQRNGFRAVTVKNTKKTNVVALEQLTKKLIHAGLTESEARDILYGPITTNKDDATPIKNFDGKIEYRHGGFTDTTVNDAQSYITVQEWVRRIAARGQFLKYLPLIKKLSDPNAVLTAKELKEFVQVQKNFYYDLWYNDKYGIEVPRQIKNAEFVLVPQLIKGTQLEQVYNMMREANIDQLNTVETSKAANENILTLWDNNGDISEETLTTFASDANLNAQLYSYNNLYTQQETVQHMKAMNKAGSQIIKKIIDNLPNDNSRLGLLKKEYFRLYSTNIETSAISLLNDLEIPCDENGNLLLDENNNIEHINLKVFYKKLEEELMRTGIDNNMLDYVKVKDDAIKPEMPEFFNNFANKFESVVQSIFNNAITRQKLPGFHAAQVTNIGFKPLSDKIENVSYDAELRYHPDGKGYIEVKLPYSVLGIDKNSKHYKNMTDKEILKELEESGLDMVIGYRIPTESKASVCNMKIVGFVSDAFGSTIIVPDDWVSQTGSDFDIDSVYGIQPETYTDKTGKVNKIAYIDKPNIYNWFSYIRRNSEESINSNVKDEIKNSKKEINALMADIFNSLHNIEEKYYNEFNEVQQKSIKQLNLTINKQIKKLDLTGKDAYLYRLQKLSNSITQTKNKSKNEEFINKCNNFIKAVNDIQDFIINEDDYFKTKVNSTIKDIIDARLDKFKAAAEKAGLMSYEDFIKPENVEKINSQKARNTRIFEIMRSILEDPANLEENLSRSNCDDLITARDNVMNDNVANQRKFRSPYNVIDQIKYQEEAMAGAKLKAISVVLDTFCSLCNTIKPTLEESIYIVYDTKSYNKPEQILKRFNQSKDKLNDKTFSIRHNTYGWTKDNRNVVGKLLTSYSAQTTAFNFDAIKWGSLPNVNTYTFQAFKTLLNAGTDYRTAVSFIMQPGITEIVKEYSKNKSIYSLQNNNAIHQAIRNIAEILNVNVTSTTPIMAVLAAINSKYKKQFNAIFKQPGDEDIDISLSFEHTKNLPIITTKLIDRLKEKGQFTSKTPIEKKALFDLGNILIFNKLYYTANRINEIANVSNPDRFGAKVSIFETRKIFEDIDNVVYDKEKVVDFSSEEGKNAVTIVKKEKPLILSVNGEHILKHIYPGIINNNYSVDDMVNSIVKNNERNNSAYPFIYAFLKNTAAISIVIDRQLFATQQEQFVKLVSNISSVFSGHTDIDKDIYDDVQKYIISSLMKDCPSMKYPVQVRIGDNGKITLTIKEPEYDPNDTSKLETETLKTRAELSRIFGYEHHGSLNRVVREAYVDKKGNIRNRTVKKPILIKDLNNPTNEELEAFEELSPAQKVKFIQNNFSNPGIFGMLKANLYNSKSRGRYAGMQTLEFIAENINPNIVYSEFRKVFFNNNPLLISTAIDIVKYSVQVEGMRMSQRAVNKVIDNDCLINSFGINGLGLIDFLNKEMLDISTTKGKWSATNTSRELYENYLRSHPDCKGIRTLYLSRKNKVTLNLTKGDFGTYFLQKEDNTPEAEKKFNERLTKMGIKYYLPIQDTYKINTYLRIKERGVSRLYKIINGGDYVILYPLVTLEANENSEWSIKESNNNGILSKNGYEALCADFAESVERTEFRHKFIKERLDHYKETGQKRAFFYNKRKDYNNKEVASINFDLNELAEEPGSGMYNVKQAIIQHFKTGYEEPLMIRSNILTDYIFSEDIEYGSLQKIKFPKENRYRNFLIYKPKGLKQYQKVYLQENGDIDAIKEKSVKDLMRQLKEDGLKYVDDIFAILPYNPNDEAYAASTEEIDEDVTTAGSSIESVLATADADVIKFMKSQRDSDNFEPAIVGLEKLRLNSISAEKESIVKNIGLATKEVSRFATHTADYINRVMFDQFVPDPNNPVFYLSIKDPKVQNLIKNDEKLLNKYLRALNIARGFINSFSHFDGIEVNSDDIDIKVYLDSIKKAVATIKQLPLEQLMKSVSNNLIDKLSTNPIIKEGLIDAFDGFWKTEGSMWQFHDIMENGTPLLQVVLKDVMGDIEAKQKHAKRDTKIFWDKINAIREAARKEGVKINWDNIVDKDGRFIRDFTNTFVDKLTELREAKETAAKTYGLGSIEHLKAQIEYDEFKATYTNQEAKPEYYAKRIQLQKLMLYGRDVPSEDPSMGTTHIPGFPKLFSKYMTLYYQKLDIYSAMSESGLTNEQLDKLRELDIQMYNLYRHDDVYFMDNKMKIRPIANSNDENYTEEEIELYNKDAAAALSAYVTSMQELNSKYFEDVDGYGFRDQLRICLNIKESFEDRDENGIPTRSQDWLESQPEYVKAVNWLANNARFEMIESRNRDTNKPISIMARLKDAFKRLSMWPNLKSEEVNRILYAHDNNKGIFDERRIPNGLKLSDDEIEKIKLAQRKAYGKKMLPEFTDRILISNAKPNEKIIYNQAFYNKLRGREKSKEYYDTVTQINKILEKYYSSVDGRIHFEDIPDNEEGLEDLRNLKELYQSLKNIQYLNRTRNPELAEFIEENVEFKENTELFNNQIQFIEQANKSTEFLKLCQEVLSDFDENGNLNVRQKKDAEGNVITDENGNAILERIPNQYLYSFVKPKGEPGTREHDRWVDTQRMEDLNLIEHVYRKVPTKYYRQAKNEALKKAEEDPSYWKTWYRANHIYNPYTRKMEPLACWLYSEVKDELFKDNELEGRWVPRLNQRDRKVKTGVKSYRLGDEEITVTDETNDMRNHDYKPDAGIVGNYIKGAQNGEYDNNVVQNKYEKEMSTLLQEILMNTATVDKAKSYFKKGYLPRKLKAATKDKNLLRKEVGKFFGFGISEENGRKPYQKEIGYEHDFMPDIPMTHLLRDKRSRDFEKEKEELEKQLKNLAPEEFDTETEYENKVKELEDQIKEKETKIKEINNELLNRDWPAVVAEYLEQIARYNAIQDNKQKLYFILDTLKHYKMYSRQYGLSGKLKQDDRQTSEDLVVYDESIDKQLIEQYENFLRRLLFNQWKEPQNTLNIVANSLQGLTSANYMMLNIKGGIANVTLGATGMLAEAAAAEYLGRNDWAFGTSEWSKGIIGYARRGFSIMNGEDRSFNKQDAIIQWFNIFDYDEWNGTVRELSVEEYSEKLRNLMFSPQHIGEHFMQNSILFSMLHSHKIIKLDDGRVVYATKRDYINYRSGDILNTILSDEQRKEFAKFKKKIKADKDVLKDYAWFRKDALTDFIYLHCTKEQINEFIEKRKKQEEEIKKEFDEKINLYEQLELGTDGHLKFKEGSDLDELDKELDNNSSNITKAEALLGRFSEKVRKVNNKIHGVYNRDGAAYIERKWYGSLIMQFHKHLPMGLLKRYMARGHWNEFRESVDKGMVQSFKDLLNLNFRKIRIDAGLSDEEVGALEAFKYILFNLWDYIAQLSTTYNILPAYEKANIARNLGDFVGVVGAMAMTAALWYIADDDEEIQDSLWFNMMLYESDRLCSEAFMYNPWGAVSEGKKLMSQPIATQSIIEDTYKTLKGVMDWMFDDEYDPYYHSGRFAGESKIWVYIQRRIPGWYGIKSVLDTPGNNHFYKFGQNPTGLLNIKEMVTDDD